RVVRAPPGYSLLRGLRIAHRAARLREQPVDDGDWPLRDDQPRPVPQGLVSAPVLRERFRINGLRVLSPRSPTAATPGCSPTSACHGRGLCSGRGRATLILKRALR